jgi:D-3-phosphoglycerate dehydrogenase
VTARDLRVFVGPDQPAAVLAAVARVGAALVAPQEANVVIWTRGPSEGIDDVLHTGVAWVQFAAAGVDAWLTRIDGTRVWTSGRGLYGARVAEHVVALILAAAKRLVPVARWTSWRAQSGDLLEGATVGIVGAGSIGVETFRRLAPFGMRRIGLTRSGRPVAGADVSLGPDGLDELLRASGYVVLAAPLTPETDGLIGERELALIGPQGWLVNVARGRLVDTDALVAALRGGGVRGACLDVTEPQPLPDGHPLWSFDNVLITSHTANPWDRHDELLAERVADNLQRFRAGRDLVGIVDVGAGY